MSLDDTLAEPVLTAPVKLVIWDLDDTFWRGTLLEGAITPVPDHIQLVRTLAERGIVSSICSKNEAGAVEAACRALGVWDSFVAPRISFAAKGQSIAAIIEALQLRPANVVFIDDNPSVLAEAAFACPGLMCLDSPARLAAALDEPCLRGAPDPSLTKLAQYRMLAERFDLRGESSASNEDFLRQSDIRLEIEYQIEPYIERIIDLINKSNQLNYTKARIETPQARAAFLEQLKAYGHNAGVVRVRDRYGDYGVVGFFMTLATLREYRLEQFVFSCRVMNMGVEQYVYEYLRTPDIEIVEPVANPIISHERVDWIGLGGEAQSIERLRDRQIVLIGGCDMLQLSTYCSSRATEFTNRDQNGLIKRLDDPFFILGDPDMVEPSELRPLIPAFNAAEMRELRTALAGADAVICSFYRMMEINYFEGSDGLIVRLDEDAVKAILASDQGLWFVRNFTFAPFEHEDRNALIHHSLERLAQLIPAGAKIVVLLENVRKLENNPNEAYLRGLYNQFLQAECALIDKLVCVDVNAVTDIAWLWDDGFHMDRRGYFELAQAVRAVIEP